MLDLVAATSVRGSSVAPSTSTIEGTSAVGKYKTVSAVMDEFDTAMVDRFEALRAAILALGDDVQELCDAVGLGQIAGGAEGD